MAASHGIFAADGKQVFNLENLLNDFNAQCNAHYERMGIAKTSQVSLKKFSAAQCGTPTHYEICGIDAFTNHLKKFFTSHGVKALAAQEGTIVLNIAELNKAKITYRDAHDYLFSLNQLIRSEENALKPRA